VAVSSGASEGVFHAAVIRLTKKQKWFKQQNLTKKDKICAGLDVHKKSISVAVWLNNQIGMTFNARLIKQHYQNWPPAVTL